MRYFITAIGTDSGKTLFSAIIAEALKADYWKPIQSGEPRDTGTVKSLVSNNKTVFHPEAYFLETPASPHAAAEIDGVVIDSQKIKVPETTNELIIEGAGGALVPINNQDFIIDLVPQFDSEIIVVSNLYLGSINHTLLTLSLLKERGYKIKGIVFNGKENLASESIILKHYDIPCLLRIKEEEKVDQETVKFYASELLKNWNE